MFILAQASSGFSDFFEQIPMGLILMFCGSAVALVVFGFLIVRARMQRAPKPLPEYPNVPVSRSAKSAGLSDAALADLPDLDLLVSAPKPTSQAASRAVRTGTYPVHLTSGETTQAVDVVTIMRDVVDGSLIIQMGDRIYRDLTHDETFRTTFLKIMRELSPVVSQATGRKTGPLPAPASDLPKAPMADPAPAAEEEALPSLRDLFTGEETPQPEKPQRPPVKRPAAPPAGSGPLPGDLPRYTLDDQPQVVKKPGRLLGRQKTEYVPVPELNLAEAIEAFLQHKLQRTPEFDGRSIHVHPAPDGGVSIEVDGVLFDSVGDVNDSEVRTYLSETIQEWQERNTGK